MDEVVVNKFTTEAGGVWAEVALNRPERKNAITGPLGVGLAKGINELNDLLIASVGPRIVLCILGTESPATAISG